MQATTRRFLIGFLALVLVFSFLQPGMIARAQTTSTPTLTPVTAQQIIDAWNALRVRHGVRLLIVDPILMALAQETADTMAVNEMNGPIGGVRERAIAAGYGAGDIPWLTENWAMGPATLEEIMAMWSDSEHMRPVSNTWYSHIGVGIAEYDGTVYYVAIFGYTSNRIYRPGATALPGTTQTAPVSQVMYPVVTVTPGADGTYLHTVLHGQTFWAIAIAYGLHIADIQRANGYAANNLTIYEGQRLIIPLEPAATQIPQGSPTASPTQTPRPVVYAATQPAGSTRSAQPTQSPTPALMPTVETPATLPNNLTVVYIVLLAAFAGLLVWWIVGQTKS